MLDGANKIKALAKRLKEFNMDSVAMTDHGNLFGAIDFYKTMKAEGIKPIIGMECYLQNGEELEDKSSKYRFHLCLYAKNTQGYKNLMYLSSMSYTKGFYYFPRISKKLLAEYSEGIVCSSACLQGEVSWHLNTNNPKNVQRGAKGYEGALKAAMEYKEIFGEDFYIELMRHGIEDQLFVDKQLIKLSKETGIKLIATNDTHYLKKDDAIAQEIFMCIAMNKLYNDPNRMKHLVHEFYLKDNDQIEKLYMDMPDIVNNTQEIANKCNLEITLGELNPPNFKFFKEYVAKEKLDITSQDEYFRYRCEIGLKQRLKLVDESKYHIYKDRLKVEMDIICNMRFAGYMLIVWDFVRAAKEDLDVPVGPGRGSAAGSLVAFSLNITDIDPMKYNLLFERFLNPARVSMPDIDMDFCQKNRDKIIKYVVDKYGRENVAQIITFNSLLPKGSIRDVARVLDMPYSKADAMAKLIPNEIGISLKESYEKEPKIKELISTDTQAKEVWERALQLEGLKRNAGIHAAGIVISDEPLWHRTPLYKPSGDDVIATQYSGKYIEDVDLIKFDFLGLKTLTVIQNTIELIKIRFNKMIDFHSIDVEDKKVYKMIESGNTIGLFQIESDGMKKLNEKLKPDSFEDVVAVLALYRPGPLESGMVDDFIDRKHGKKKINYFFDEFNEVLEPILKSTYGVILYQEQVMSITQVVAGYSLGEADLIRRAMGKKDPKVMAEHKENFANQAEKKGFNRKNASDLFGMIEKFAGYGFNKSHSAAYAMITFQTSYLKAYYPSEFMASLLSSDKDNTDKVARYIDEAKRMGIEILPPNINKSEIDFSVVDLGDKDGIVFGLAAIKGIGAKAVEPILENRKENGEFKSLNDFVARVSNNINKRLLDAMINSGCLDVFEYNRKTLFNNVEYITSSSQRVSKGKKEVVDSLFSDFEDEVIGVDIVLKKEDDYEQKELLQMEKELIGFYISGHPLDKFREDLEATSYTLSSRISEVLNDSEVVIIGKIENLEERFSKKGNKFGIVTLLDLHGNIEFMVFEDMIKKIHEFNLEDPIAFKVKVNNDGDFTRISTKKVMSLKEAKKMNVSSEYIHKRDPNTKDTDIMLDINHNEMIIDKILELSRIYTGDSRLNIIFKDDGKDIILKTSMFVGDAFKDELNKQKKMLG
jgi:DNA polymerase-3 subunit alpha